MGGATDVQGGHVSSGPPGGDGGGGEHSGGCPGVRAAPGHRAQDAGLLRSAGLPATDSARRPKLESYTGVIDRILEDDLGLPKKQRHTAKRIFERLRGEYGFDGGYTTVKDYVREHRRLSREMFVPLSHAPGHAQFDFGEASVIIGGVEQKAHYLTLDLPHSGGCFVKAYPAETQGLLIVGQ